jgi:hypothetical protein
MVVRLLVAGYRLLVFLETGCGYASIICLDRAHSWIMLAGSLYDWRRARDLVYSVHVWSVAATSKASCTGQGRLCELHTRHEAISSNTRSICVSNASLYDESAMLAVSPSPLEMRVGYLALGMAGETMRVLGVHLNRARLWILFARMYVDTPKYPICRRSIRHGYGGIWKVDCPCQASYIHVHVYMWT